jgi:hypothetical protein
MRGIDSPIQQNIQKTSSTLYEVEPAVTFQRKPEWMRHIYILTYIRLAVNCAFVPKKFNYLPLKGNLL